MHAQPNLLAQPLADPLDIDAAPTVQSTGLQRVIFAIDPGPSQSGYVIWDHAKSQVIDSGVWTNAHILKLVAEAWSEDAIRHLAIEWVESFGTMVGAELFDTVRWVGRFQQAWPEPEAVRLVTRKNVKRCLCGKTNLPAAAVRQAILERFGADAVGNKRNPGPLFGVKSHAWSALGVAITACETR